MLGTLQIAYKLLVNDRPKFAALLVGITFAVYLMIEMTSLFAGILTRSSATVINIGASIWVMDPGVQTVANSIALPEYVLDEVRSMPGVRYAVPLYSGGALLKVRDGTYQAANVVGLDDTSLFGRPELTAGRIEDIFAENAFIAIDDAEFSKLQNPTIGTDFELNDHRGVIVGIGKVASSALFGVPTLYTTHSRALQYIPNSRFTISCLLVEPKTKADVKAIQQRVAAAGYVALTPEEFIQKVATFLTQQANVVNTVIARAGYRAQIEATQQLISLAGEQVRLTQIRVDAGTAPYSSLLSLRSQLAQYQASTPELQQRVTRSDDLLATLAGVTPAQWTTEDISLAQLTLPAQLPVSVPATLLAQRPDVRASEALLHQASANIGVITAAMLPSLTLNGSYSANASGTATLLQAAGREWSTGANLTLPLFQGATLWCRRRAAIDNYAQANAQYRQTVLGAFAQVADVLGALDHDAAAARDAQRLVQIDYEAGLDTYLEVLSANAQSQQALINQLQIIAQRFQDTVALYVALGGGWSQEDP